MDYVHAFSWGSNTLIGGLSGATTVDEDAPLESLFPLGGLFRLSGLQENQLYGQHVGLATIAYLLRLQESRFLQSYILATIEAGNVWQDRSNVSLDNSIISGSAFLGFDTAMGRSIWLMVGRTPANPPSTSTWVHV